jgi:nucleoid-associated protein YgaU
MKMPSIIKRKKLHAAAAVRRSRAGIAAGMDYEEMGEPNMKLSRALLIVLLLHIVAVAGIVAFNTIKTREGLNVSSAEPAPRVAAATPEATPGDALPAAVPDEMTKAAAATEAKPAVPPTETPRNEKAAKAQEPAKKATTISVSGKIYTVVRGDNPVTIAHRFHVDYGALLELNGISDPRKLQIGTRLHIPERKDTKDSD